MWIQSNRIKLVFCSIFCGYIRTLEFKDRPRLIPWNVGGLNAAVAATTSEANQLMTDTPEPLHNRPHSPLLSSGMPFPDAGRRRAVRGNYFNIPSAPIMN